MTGVAEGTGATEGSATAELAVPDLMYPAFLKLAHANTHFTALGDEVRTFLAQNEPEMVVEYDPTTGWQSVRIVAIPELPRDWGVILGDALHDCRSALDNTVASLVRLAAGEPTRSSEFPILVNPRGGPEQPLLTALTGVLHVYQEPVRAAQPYLVGADRDQHPLAILQALSNADKHRVVHVATITPTEGAYRLGTTVGNEIAEQRQSEGGLALTPGTEIVQVRTAPDPEAPVAVEMKFGVDIGFATASGAPTLATLPALAQTYAYLMRLVQSFFPFFTSHLKLPVPADVLGRGRLVTFTGFHTHDGQQVRCEPEATEEKLDQPDGVHTYRYFRCPQCGGGAYAEVAADVALR